MVKVPSWTTKTGFQTRTQNLPHYRYLNENGKKVHYGAFTNSSVQGYSLRYPPIKGIPPYPTNYTRKIGVVQPNNYWIESQWTTWGNSGVYIALARIPHGSDFAAADVVVPSWMTDTVIQKCISDLNGMRANVLEDLGQARSTLQQLVSLFNLVLASFNDMYRGRYKKAYRRIHASIPRSTKDAAGAWLAWFYGIKPILSTMDTIAASYKPQKSISKTARSTQETSVDPLGFVNVANYSFWFPPSGTAMQQARAALTVTVDVSADLARGEALGFSGNIGQDAFVTAWALAPYSFVVDWILPVEQFLRTRTWSSGIKYQYGHVTKRLICDAKFTRKGGLSYVSTVKSATWPSATIKVIQLQRMAYNSFSPPSGLSFRVNLTPTRLLNAAALLHVVS